MLSQSDLVADAEVSGKYVADGKLVVKYFINGYHQLYVYSLEAPAKLIKIVDLGLL